MHRPWQAAERREEAAAAASAKEEVEAKTKAPCRSWGVSTNYGSFKGSYRTPSD